MRNDTCYRKKKLTMMAFKEVPSRRIFAASKMVINKYVLKACDTQFIESYKN